MSEWVTQVEAAEILGVHRSLIPKMLRRGDLVSRPRRPSLLRSDVVALAQARAASAAEQQESRPKTKKWSPSPPDDEHHWLPLGLAAAVMGCSEVALRARARRERVPSALADGRRWFRLDLLELQLRAVDARARGLSTTAADPNVGLQQ